MSIDEIFDNEPITENEYEQPATNERTTIEGTRTIVGDVLIAQNSDNELGNLTVEGNLTVSGSISSGGSSSGGISQDVDLAALAVSLSPYLNGSEPVPGATSGETTTLDYVTQSNMVSYVTEQISASVPGNEQIEFTEYSSQVAYNEGDIVYYGGKYYRRTSESPGMSAWEPAWPAIHIWDEIEYDDGTPAGWNDIVEYTSGKYSLKATALPTSVFFVTGVVPRLRPEAIPDDLYEQLAPRYNWQTAYQLGDMVSYNKQIFVRVNQPGETSLAPELSINSAWREVTLSEGLLSSIPTNVSYQRRVIRTVSSNNEVDLSDNVGVIKVTASSGSLTLIHQPSLLNPTNMTYWGSNLVEFEIIINAAVQITSFTWNSIVPIWGRGSLNDLTAGKHLIKFRILPQLEMNEPGAIIAEYICPLPTTF